MLSLEVESYVPLRQINAFHFSVVFRTEMNNHDSVNIHDLVSYYKRIFQLKYDDFLNENPQNKW